MSYFIGIDVGTSSVKAAVLRDGRTRTVRALYDEALGNTPEGWWKAVCDAAAQAAAEEGTDCAGIGLTAQVGTYLLADPDKPASAWPVYTWGGPGGERQRDELQARFGTDFFMAHTGMPLPKVPSYPASRLRWFAEEKAHEWQAARQVLAPKDFLYTRPLLAVIALSAARILGLITISEATPDIAFSIIPRLFSIPFASPPMKSGIQLS